MYTRLLYPGKSSLMLATAADSVELPIVIASVPSAAAVSSTRARRPTHHRDRPLVPERVVVRVLRIALEPRHDVRVLRSPGASILVPQDGRPRCCLFAPRPPRERIPPRRDLVVPLLRCHGRLGRAQAVEPLRAEPSWRLRVVERRYPFWQGHRVGSAELTCTHITPPSHGARRHVGNTRPKLSFHRLNPTAPPRGLASGEADANVGRPGADCLPSRPPRPPARDWPRI